MFGFGDKKQRTAATFRASDIESVDYANSRARVNPVRNFSQTVPLLSAEEMERAYRGSGLIFKGVNKKARDSLRKGFRVVPDEEDREDADGLNADAREWMRSTGYLPKAIQALREMFVFGDGFLELAYGNKTGGDSSAPAPNRAPLAVYNVDPFSILPVRNPDTGEIKAYFAPAGTSVPAAASNSTLPLPGQPSAAGSINVRGINREEVRAWASGKGTLPRGVVAIHPSRIQHFQVNALRQHPDGLGIGVVQAAYINLLAKLAGDLAAGDILEWYSKGFFVLNIENGTPEEIEEALKGLEAAKQARKNYFVGSERTKFDIKSPLAPQVKQFYENFHIEISAALEMPVMVLLGVQTGTVTGSETDLTQYYDDVHGFQTLHLEAPILDMMRRVLGRADISVEFGPLYVNKQTEADVAFKRAQATSQLFGSNVLSRAEAIRFMRDGTLPNPDEVPDDYDSDPAAEGGAEAPADPSGSEGGGEEPPASSAEKSDDGDEESVLSNRVFPLSPTDRAQIEALRRYGEKIIREQDEMEE